MKKQTLITFSFISLFIIIVLVSCKKEEKTSNNLFSESTSSNLKFYKNKDTLYSPAGNSPHGDFKLKFNSTALALLDSTGKLPKGVAFSYGSLIVKEIYKNGKLFMYAVMKKTTHSKFAYNEWMWAEYSPEGEEIYGIGLRGKACISCHQTGLSRDFTRSFDLH